MEDRSFRIASQTGETLGLIGENGSMAELPALVLRAGEHLREKLGLEKRPDTGDSEFLTSLPSNWEASRSYAEGLEKLRAYDFSGAVPSLEEAIAAEPTHAFSHRALAEALNRLGFGKRAAEAAKKAFELAEGLTRGERLSIEASYHEMTHQREKVVEIYRALFTVFPDDLDYGLRLASAQGEAGSPAK